MILFFISFTAERKKEKEGVMTPDALNPSSARFEFMKWVSERNAHIPMSELEFLIGIPPFGCEDDDEWEDCDRG